MSKEDPSTKSCDKVDFERDSAELTLQLCVDWSKFADTKATIILTGVVAVVGISLMMISDMTKAIAWLYMSNFKCSLLLLLILIFLFYLSTGVSIAKLVKALRPRFATRPSGSNPYFFSELAKLNVDDAVATFTSECKEETRVRYILDQAIENAQVTVDKFNAINSALNWLLVSFTLGVISAIVVQVLSVLIGI